MISSTGTFSEAHVTRMSDTQIQIYKETLTHKLNDNMSEIPAELVSETPILPKSPQPKPVPIVSIDEFKALKFNVAHL